jgi:hypothetical protein
MLAPGFEVMCDPPMARKGKAIMKAMVFAAPKEAVITGAYEGRREWLMLYGAGSEPRQRVLKEHLARGGHYVIWDLGYWDRETAMRTAINGLHPSADQLQSAPATGWRHVVSLREDANLDGPIVLIGLGVKSASLFYKGVGVWEQKALAMIRERWPDKKVIWRPKGKVFEQMSGTVLASMETPIERVLKGAALVVCRHSNVAIDACIAGVPVMCEDGAAYAIYKDKPNPSREHRLEFLRRLGWFNWRPEEAKQAWLFIQHLIATCNAGQVQ